MEKENNCPNRYKCITNSNGRGIRENFCNKGKVIKFTLYIPKSKPMKIRARILSLGVTTMTIFKYKIYNKHNKWFDKGRLMISLKKCRFIQYPIYCNNPKCIILLTPEKKRV